VEGIEATGYLHYGILNKYANSIMVSTKNYSKGHRTQGLGVAPIHSQQVFTSMILKIKQIFDKKIKL
jgi:hypothetical protein